MSTSPATTAPLASTSKPVVVEVPIAAQMLHVSDWAAYQAIRAGTFPVPIIRIGRRIVVPLAPLERLLGLGDGDHAE